MSLPKFIFIDGEAPIPLDVALQISSATLTAVVAHMTSPGATAPPPMFVAFDAVRASLEPYVLAALEASE